jgi:hypothetical protein
MLQGFSLAARRKHEAEVFIVIWNLKDDKLSANTALRY